MAYTRAAAAVVSVGGHLQPFASSLTVLSFHVGSIYLSAHLRCNQVFSFKLPQFYRAYRRQSSSNHPPPPISIVEVAAIVELILYPAFMALRVTLLPVAPPPQPASPAPLVFASRAVNADAAVN